MANNYKNEQSNIETTIVKLNQNIANYDAKIADLTALLNEIKSSSDWDDPELKPSFISTFQSYITLYQKLSASISKNIKFIKQHNDKISELNSQYKKGA